MGLFFISLILITLTAFFITSIFEKKSFIKIFIYMSAIMFSTIVLDIEILSLINSISPKGILLLNAIGSIFAGIIWYKNGKPLFNIKTKRFFKKLYYSVLSDKYLLILGLAFIFMLLTALFIIAFMPVVNGDASSYHVLRSLFWIGNKNLSHFETADFRNLIMPINSEILYTWLFIFLKRQLWLGIFPFIGFLMSVFSLYGILGKIKFSERHKLWTIFILSSFPAVIIQLSSTETDLIISGLILSGIYLFWEYNKTKKLHELYISSLLFALAIGTKTPALMLLFPVGLWILWISYKNDGENCYKILLKFSGFGLINFIIFSSYNYVLNFLDFGNIFGPQNLILAHKNLYGLKGCIANFIKHIFLFVDFTGFNWDKVFGVYVIKLKSSLLAFLHLSNIPDGVFTNDNNNVNTTLIDSLTGLGILGFITFLPCWIYSLFKPLFKQDEKTKVIFSFGLILLGAILVMSYVLAYMVYNIRFVMSFCIISSPILVYSYSRKNSVLKFIITMFALFGLLLVSTNIWRVSVVRIVKHMKQGYGIHEIRQLYMCSLLEKTPLEHYKYSEPDCIFSEIIKNNGINKKYLYLANAGESLLITKSLMFYGYDVDYKLLENISNEDLKQYDTIFIRNMLQSYGIKQAGKSEKYYPFKGVECNYIYSKTKVPFDTVCTVNEQFFINNNYKLKNIHYIMLDNNIKIMYYQWDRVIK